MPIFKFREADLDFIAAIASNIIGIVTLSLFFAGVLKVFQAANTLNEIKDLLQKRQAGVDEFPPVAAPLASRGPSGEEMLRALDREMRIQEDSSTGSVEGPGIDPEVVNPGKPL